MTRCREAEKLTIRLQGVLFDELSIEAPWPEDLVRRGTYADECGD
jgi:hypothetical protein